MPSRASATDDREDKPMIIRGFTEQDREKIKFSYTSKDDVDAEDVLIEEDETTPRQQM